MYSHDDLPTLSFVNSECHGREQLQKVPDYTEQTKKEIDAYETHSKLLEESFEGVWISFEEMFSSHPLDSPYPDESFSDSDDEIEFLSPQIAAENRREIDDALESFNDMLDSKVPSPFDDTVKLCEVCNFHPGQKSLGAFCCEVCSEFFAQCIRRKRFLSCINNRNCTVSRWRRNDCAYCRLQKSFQVGMFKSVSLRNDVVRLPEQRESRYLQSIHPRNLGRLEFYFRVCVLPQSLENLKPVPSIGLQQTIDLLDCELRSLLDWLRAFHAFRELLPHDQRNLLNKGSLQWIVMDAAIRSELFHEALVLNDTLVTRSERSGDRLQNLFKRITKELAQPLRSLRMNLNEFATLKCISLFDPNNHRVADKSKVHEIRTQLQLSLEDYSESRELFRGRFGQMLLLLPTVKSLAEDLHCLIVSANDKGLVQISETMNEWILGGSRPFVNAYEMTSIVDKATSKLQPSLQCSSIATLLNA